METTKEFNVGDKVTFGCFGYFDVRDTYTIVGKEKTLPMLGDYTYTIEKDGHKQTAYADELELIKEL